MMTSVQYHQLKLYMQMKIDMQRKYQCLSPWPQNHYSLLIQIKQMIFSEIVC